MQIVSEAEQSFVCIFVLSFLVASTLSAHFRQKYLCPHVIGVMWSHPRFF